MIINDIAKIIKDNIYIFFLENMSHTIPLGNSNIVQTVFNVIYINAISNNEYPLSNKKICNIA